MRVERVCDNKIKVSVDGNEARRWNINTKSITQNTPEVQRMFRAAIQMAKEIDFSIDGAKLFVETLSDSDDGVGMMITRIFNENDLQDAIDNCPYPGKLHRNELKPVRNCSVKQIKYIYKFDSFDSVCSAAGEMNDKYRGLSMLYKLDSAYYLYLIPFDESSVSDFELILSEFGIKQIHGQYLHGRLNEYGEVMVEENAVSVLSEYFCKI